jgi:hypothetical protein
MTADLKELSDSLRSDTPEKVFQRQIADQRSELVAALKADKPFAPFIIRDLSGRIVQISPSQPRNAKI